MRRLSLPLVILFALLLAAGLAWLVLSRGSLWGTGVPINESHPLAPFKRLSVTGDADITLVQGAEESLTVESVSKGGSRVDASVTGDALSIQAGGNRHWWEALVRGGSSVRPRIVVHFRDLESISAAGNIKLAAGAIRVPALKVSGAGGTSLRIDDLTAETLRLSGAGALKAELGGRVKDQHVAISGAGDYRGERLASEEASVSVSGAGRVVVAVEKTLRVSISGAGSVEYLGDPTVKKEISGAGRVKRRDTAEEAAAHVASAR